jgi:hypothetical protein
MLYRLAFLSVILVGITTPARLSAQNEIPDVRHYWVIRQYLILRHFLTAQAPDVVLCSEGIPDDYATMIGRDRGLVTTGMIRSIQLVDTCGDQDVGDDTLFIYASRLVVDSTLGELSARIRLALPTANQRLEQYRDQGFGIEFIAFSVDSARDVGMIRSETAIRYEPLRYYLAVRRRLVPLGGRPWVVICDESVSPSVVNDYVLGNNGGPSQYVMVYDPACGVPTEVQRDTSLSVVLVRKLEETDGRVVVESVRTTARTPFPRQWEERFELLPDGRATIVLRRFKIDLSH